MVKKNSKTTGIKMPQLINAAVPFEYEEAYKALRTSFKFVAGNGKNRRIVVTSTLQGEGKSSVCVNLAISLVQTGSKVLLIDADTRNPSLHRYLRLKKNPAIGLSTLLAGDVKVGDCLLHTDYGFDVITGGPIPPNPVELIGSEAMKSLLQVATEHYDYVICDTPPVGVVTDAAELSHLCDGVLYVIKQKYANKNQVHSALQNLKRLDAKILGTVLNQYDISRDAEKGYGYYRSYGYGAE